MTPVESAVIVTVPAAEPVVGEHRARLDQAAGWGVPAHVTVLYPFVSPRDLDLGVLERLARAVASVARFDATYQATGWFGAEILWLEPRPRDRFQALTSAVAAAFPSFPPYGGAHPDVVPHLTVGDCADELQLVEAERHIVPRLPVEGLVTSASLWCGSPVPGSWRQVAALPLG